MATSTMGGRAAASAPMTAQERKVIFASSLGTVFEWYDFYLYGSLAAIIAKQFFSGLDAGSAFIFALLAFAAGFIVRPFGAIVFGRIGDLVGRVSVAGLGGVQGGLEVRCRGGVRVLGDPGPDGLRQVR